MSIDRPAQDILPVELWITIVGHLDTRGLAVLSLVGRLLYDITLPGLYSDPLHDSSFDRTKLIDTLSRRPDLCELVRSYHSSVDRSDVTPNSVLRAMTNLTHATLRTRTHLTQFITACPSIGLQRLSVDLDRSNLSLEEIITFRQWVLQQGKLVSFEWVGGWPESLAASPTLLPNLTVLGGHDLLAVSLLPGRPIKEFHTTRSIFLTREIITVLPLFSERMRRVQLDINSKNIAIALQLLTRHSPNVTDISLSVYDFQPPLFAKRALPFIRHFPSLEHMALFQRLYFSEHEIPRSVEPWSADWGPNFCTLAFGSDFFYSRASTDEPWTYAEFRCPHLDFVLKSYCFDGFVDRSTSDRDL